MKDLPEFKDVTDDEDRKTAYDKFIKRQKVSRDVLFTSLNAKEKLREAELSDHGSTGRRGSTNRRDEGDRRDRDRYRSRSPQRDERDKRKDERRDRRSPGLDDRDRKVRWHSMSLVQS